jgi:hypothetical protein
MWRAVFDTGSLAPVKEIACHCDTILASWLPSLPSLNRVPGVPACLLRRHTRFSTPSLTLTPIGLGHCRECLTNVSWVSSYPHIRRKSSAPAPLCSWNTRRCPTLSLLSIHMRRSVSTALLEVSERVKTDSIPKPLKAAMNPVAVGWLPGSGTSLSPAPARRGELGTTAHGQRGLSIQPAAAQGELPADDLLGVLQPGPRPGRASRWRGCGRLAVLKRCPPQTRATF